MNTPKKTSVLLATLAGVTALVSVSIATAKEVKTLSNAKLVGDEVITTPHGEITLTDNFITKGQQELFDAMDFQRASQAYIWASPAVSFYSWSKQQAEVFDAHNLGDFVVYQTEKQKRGIVTANMTTPYIINFLSLEEGSVKVQIPAGKIAGISDDLWQRPVTDLGLTGPDKGRGGTYIIVGPSDDATKYNGQADYIVQSATNNIFVGLRLLDSSPEFIARVRKEFKIGRVGEPYVLAKFITDVDKEWSATAPRGIKYWELLAEWINHEPTREIDKSFMALLEPLGIKKGQPFNPSERQKEILIKGAAFGELMQRNMQTNPRFSEVYWEGTSWYKSFDFGISQETKDKQQIDERGVWFYEAVTSSKGMVTPTPGKGQVYMTTKRDNNGELFRADRTYKLHVPADVPVGQFWSLTLYSEETRRPYNNGATTTRGASLGSRLKDLRRNDDGSIDLYIGPKAPKGYEKNWMKTVDDDGWFVYFRLYAPLEPWFDKSFKLSDFEHVK